MNYTPFEIYNWITDAQIKAGPKTVLLTLARFMSKENGSRVWPSQKTIAGKALMNRDTVRAHLRTLEKLGFIETQRIKIPKGERCEYLILVGADTEKLCTPVPKKPAPYAEKPCIKETDKKGLYPEKKVEGTSYRKQSLAGGNPRNSQKDSGAEVEQLTRDYYPQWTKSRSARLAVFCKLGRKHFPGSPYFVPGKKFSPHHLTTLDDLFDQWGKWAADVFDYLFANWGEMRPAHRVTPTLIALERIDDQWPYILEVYKKARHRKTYDTMIARVEKRMASPQWNPKTGQYIGHQAA